MSDKPPAAPAVTGTNQGSKLTIAASGQRRVILGPPAKSKGGGSIVRFDGAADIAARDKIPVEKRLGSVHVLEGQDAENIRKSPTFAAMGEKLGLRAS